jgi:hypothetical protein
MPLFLYHAIAALESTRICRSQLPGSWIRLAAVPSSVLKDVELCQVVFLAFLFVISTFLF